MIYFTISILLSILLWHGTSPWIADGGVGLQWRSLTANIRNKQLWTADKEWSSS